MDYDVVVIGAGPAGSTAGNLLAQRGHSVLILDKETFPRFHIGESLLPCGLPIYAQLGLDLAAGPFQFKAGAEFVDERTGQYARYDFSDGLPGSEGFAYQVDRATFDHALLQCAERAGARSVLGEKVLEVNIAADAVQVVTASESYRARYCIDATGQDAFLARKQHQVEAFGEFGKAAAFCHFHGLAPEVSAELCERGHIKVVMIDDGWAWLIPLPGGTLSCGVVTRRTGISTQWLDEFIAASPLVQRLTRGATRSPGRLIRNFSYRNRQPHGSRWACIGDASCFLDPVFSSGVSLAVLSAERLSGLLSPALAEGREAEPELMAAVSGEMERAYRSIGALIYSFYHTHIVHNLFFAPDPEPEFRAGLISLLAGDVWRTDNRSQEMLLRSSRRTRAGGSGQPGAKPVLP
jgi:flavin-dependent dehydrogenase